MNPTTPRIAQHKSGGDRYMVLDPVGYPVYCGTLRQCEGYFASGSADVNPWDKSPAAKRAAAAAFAKIPDYCKTL